MSIIGKPTFLYHGSPYKDIEEFVPKISRGSGEVHGALVYATQDIATAAIFLAKVKDGWSAGIFNDIQYALIPLEREEFIRNDKGGCIYVLPSETFECDPNRGLGPYEWVSKVPVKPIKKMEYTSALEAMLLNGIQVYFTEKEVFRKIKASKDHGFSIIQSLPSENQRRGINIKLLGEEQRPPDTSSLS